MKMISKRNNTLFILQLCPRPLVDVPMDSERKKLEEVYKNYIQPRIPFAEMDTVLEQLESMQQDRQVISAHGATVYQECRSVAAQVQGALRTLQNNAAARIHKKRAETGGKGKFF